MANMVWNTDADRKLLINILGQCSTKLDYKALAQTMTTPENVCNEKSIRNRINRLKAEVKSATENGKASPASTPSKTPASGQKRKAAKQKTGGSAKNIGMTIDDDNDERNVKIEKDDPETPLGDDYDETEEHKDDDDF